MLRLNYLPLQRSFTTFSPLLAKKVKGGKKGAAAAVEEPEETVDLSKYVTTATERFNEVLALQKSKLQETKMGASNPKIFNNLKVNNQPFSSVATTAVKGRNLIITVFDPKDTKNVVSAVLASNMNLNPVAIPNNEQQLKVPLPPPTKEHKDALAKELKAVFESFKNSPSKHSLATIRGDALKDLKSIKKNDQVTKVVQQIEKLHKDYSNKLQEQFKAASQ